MWYDKLEVNFVSSDHEKQKSSFRSKILWKLHQKLRGLYFRVMASSNSATWVYHNSILLLSFLKIWHFYIVILKIYYNCKTRFFTYICELFLTQFCMQVKFISRIDHFSVINYFLWDKINCWDTLHFQWLYSKKGFIN